MDTSKVSSWIDTAQPILIAFGLKVIGAVIAFMVGRWLINLATRLVGAAMTRQELERVVGSPATAALWALPRALDGFSWGGGSVQHGRKGTLQPVGIN